MSQLRSKQVQDFIKAGGVVQVIPPEKTLKKYLRQYKKDKSVMGPSKRYGSSS